MVHSLLMRQPELREIVRAGLHDIRPETVQTLKQLLGSLQRSELAGTRYKPEFCEVCYCHRDARSAAYCQLHKPLAEDKKAYVHGKRRFDEFFEAAVKHYNAANAAKMIPHGLDMVISEGFNYSNIVRLLSAFPLSNAKLLPVVNECQASTTPISSFDVLAKIYGKSLDPDGVELVSRVKTADPDGFRCLQDLMHFVVRYEACLSIRDGAPKRRGPKVKHTPEHIRKAVSDNPGKSKTQIAKELQCSRTILYQALKQS